MGWFSRAKSDVAAACSDKFAIQQRELEEKATSSQLGCLAILVCSVVLVALGLIISAGGYFDDGLAVIFLGAGLGFLSYNGYKIFENIGHMAREPKGYQNSLMETSFDVEKVKGKILEETVGLTWAGALISKAVVVYILDPAFK